MSTSPAMLRSILLRELGNTAPEADLEALDPQTDVRVELDIDSFDFVRYIAAVCDALGIDVPEQDYMEFSSLSRAIRYLETCTGDA